MQLGKTKQTRFNEWQRAGPENQFFASSLCLLISRDHHYLIRLDPQLPNNSVLSVLPFTRPN